MFVVRAEDALVIIVVNMILSFILFGKKDKRSPLCRIPMWSFDCNVDKVSFLLLPPHLVYPALRRRCRHRAVSK